MSSLVHITEERVRALLDWQSTVQAVETSLAAVSKKQVVQNPRSFTRIPNTGNVLLCMPGYLDDEIRGLGCKMVTMFAGNEQRKPPLPSILANILLFDDNTGQLNAIVAATEITAWRTAAASVVATKYLHLSKKYDVLAIMGAGTQGRIHAIAFHNIFKFKQIRIWNRSAGRGQKLTAELLQMGIPVTFYEDGQECVENANVIVTATSSPMNILKYDWIQKNVHINAVGAGQNHNSELDEDIYKNSTIYVDHMDSAKIELAELSKIGVSVEAELGQVILRPETARGQGLTIFHSLGMAVEDVAVGKLVYDRHCAS